MQYPPRTRAISTEAAYLPIDVGSTVVLHGWVQHVRQFGAFLFVVLRDGTGPVQLVIDEQNKDLFIAASTLGLESVVSVTGAVRARPAEQVRAKEGEATTGAVEVLAQSMQVLNKARTLPFHLFAGKAATEEIRLRYRYLDLRNPVLQRNLRLRSKTAKTVRDYLGSQRFTEVETPTLFRATPEGAREFIVPTRQRSPQQYKQLLMAGGLDRYFQLARCYRDEAQRSDRQPEFTQIDIEMSFITPQDIYNLIEGLLKQIWKDSLGIDIPTPFPHMTFAEAIRRFGSDKPDTRYGMELKEVTDVFAGTEISFLRDLLAKGGRIQAMAAKGMAGLTPKECEPLEDEAKSMGAKGISFLKARKKWSGPLASHLSKAQIDALTARLGVQSDDLVIICGTERPDIAAWALGKVRVAIADMMQKRGLLTLSPDQYNFLWVDDFPLFDVDDKGGLVTNHHPFTAPLPQDVPLLTSSPEKVRGLHYDIVLNGVELGGGSIRIHDPELQLRIMRDNLKLGTDLINRFSHLLDALAYGCPPHGGIALGFDRLMAQLCHAASIRDVIAFPKAASGNELMTNSPGELTEEELKLCSLSLAPPPQGSGQGPK